MMFSTKTGLSVAVLSALTVARVAGQSCVQVTSAIVSSSCPCDQASVSFTLEGETSVGENTINLALILDGSRSIDEEDFVLEKNFAKQTVAAFADKNLFVNGGEASYVQYSTNVVSSATFNSVEDFDEFADADPQSRLNTNTAKGIDEGTEILLTNPASALFMIVITDGDSQDDPITAADAARAEGIEVFAVGIGDNVNGTELLGIAGDASRLFNATDFTALDEVLENILTSDEGSSIPCPSTTATVVVEFRIPVISTPTSGGTISGDIVTFTAADLESTAAEFEVVLDVCSYLPGYTIIDSTTYTDDQGNDPDLSRLTSIVVGNDFCDSPTVSPAPFFSLAPTVPTTPALTTAPTTTAPQLPTPTPPQDTPTSPAPTQTTTPAPSQAPTSTATPTPTRSTTQAPSKLLTPVPTTAPTSAPVATPTQAPWAEPTTAPARPTSDEVLEEDSAKDASYIGCYVSDPKNKVLTFKDASGSMTADVCADMCRRAYGDYFGTSFSYACSCGDFQPKTTAEGVCDAACAGDDSVACGGTNMISLFKFD